jgi:hypothetical protein
MLICFMCNNTSFAIFWYLELDGMYYHFIVLSVFLQVLIGQLFHTV